MSEQQTLLPTTVHHEQPPAQEFVLTVQGETVKVKYQPDWGGYTEDIFSNRAPFRTIHVEFFSDGPGPISETGYRSHFITGSGEQLGINNVDLPQELPRLANRLADEYSAKRRCIVCLCTDEGYLPDSCYSQDRQQFCHWVVADLCSACLESQID